MLAIHGVCWLSGPTEGLLNRISETLELYLSVVLHIIVYLVPNKIVSSN